MPTLSEFVGNLFTHIVNPILFILGAIAVILFLFGLVKFIAVPDKDEKREEGKRHMIFGLVGLFIIFFVEGLLLLLTDVGNSFFPS